MSLFGPQKTPMRRTFVCDEVGFLGYTGAGDFEETLPHLKEACSYFAQVQPQVGPQFFFFFVFFPVCVWLLLLLLLVLLRLGRGCCCCCWCFCWGFGMFWMYFVPSFFVIHSGYHSGSPRSIALQLSSEDCFSNPWAQMSIAQKPAAVSPVSKASS